MNIYFIKNVLIYLILFVSISDSSGVLQTEINMISQLTGTLETHKDELVCEASLLGNYKQIQTTPSVDSSTSGNCLENIYNFW